jgi:hypothetical protein
MILTQFCLVSHVLVDNVWMKVQKSKDESTAERAKEGG